MADTNGLCVAVFCGMTDKKLAQKLAPIQALPTVAEILLVRRTPYHGEKIVNYAVPGLLRGTVLTTEMWRLLVAVWIGLFRRPSVAVCMTLLAHGIHVYLLKLLFGVPAVFHIMGKQDLAQHLPTARVRQRARWAFALKGDVLVTRGEQSRRQFIEHGGLAPERVFVQHNVFDFSGYDPAPDCRKVYDLIYVGYLSPYKSVDELLDIVALVTSVRPRVQVALVGDGPTRADLEAQAEALGLKNNVHFLGSMDEAGLIGALQRSRLFVMASLGEGLPQAMIEAMACGLPCVLYDDADMRDVLQSGINGMLVKPSDRKGFAEAVLGLLDDADRYTRFSRDAAKIRSVWGETFSLETQQDVWHQILSAVCRQGEGRQEH